jgi:uncharacterized RDD family membrane protein YckC
MDENPYAAPRSDLNEGALSAPKDERPLATLGSRFGARMLDWAVEVGPMIVILIAAGIIGATSSGDSTVAALLVVVGYLGAFGMFIYNTVLLVKTGQTLGKKWVGIQVVRMDGDPVTFGSHFVRGLIYAFAGILDVVFIFRADRRCLHDLGAETKVVVARGEG